MNKLPLELEKVVMQGKEKRGREQVRIFRLSFTMTTFRSIFSNGNTEGVGMRTGWDFSTELQCRSINFNGNTGSLLA